MYKKLVGEFYENLCSEILKHTTEDKKLLYENLTIADDKGHTYDVEYIKKNNEEGMTIRLNRR